jgi:hypothetical protein
MLLMLKESVKMIRSLFLFLVVALVGFVACTSKKSKVIENQFRFQIESDPPTLDSVMAQEHIGIELIYNLQEGLVKEDKDFNVIPGLAEKWEISPDKKTYTFHLRDSKWSDGVPVKAGDFLFAWQRLLDPKTAATSAYFLFDIENAEAFNAKKITDFSQVGIKVIDDKTIQIKIKNPASYFLHMLTCPTAVAQREDIFKAQPKDAYDAPHLRSTGPFRLSEWKHDSKLVLEPNPYYWDRKPQVAKVIYYVVREEATAKFVKLLDILVGNTAVALAPIETLTLDGYNPGEYKVLPTTTGRYATYEVGRLKLAYTAIPTHLTLFDPMIMSVLYGLAKAAHLLMFWGLEEDVLSSVSEEDIVSAIKNRYRDKAYLNMFQALSVLYKINKQYKILGVDNIMRQRSDVTAILRLRAKLRDLPLSGIKNNWLAPYKYDTGRYLFHNWKKDKCPDVWSHRRAPAQ